MDILLQAWTYALAHQSEFTLALLRHVLLVSVALGVGIVICLPLSILTSRSRMAALAIINAVNALRVIPSLAILFLAIPYLGLSAQSAALALTVLALPPILINSDAGFRNVDPAVREAAFGMGMTANQVLWRVELPLALPIILAGVRTAMVEVIASATLAAFVGGGGLGTFVTLGFALYDNAILLVGAVPVAVLAILAEVGMSGLQRLAQSPRARG
jgi:osmoprotectant transport system permease protein